MVRQDGPPTQVVCCSLNQQPTSTSNCLRDSGPALSRFCASYGRFSNNSNPSEHPINSKLHVQLWIHS